MRNFFNKCIRILSAMYTALVFLLAIELIESEVPDNIYVRDGEEARLNVEFPFVVTSLEDESGVEKKLCSIFGLIPIKEVTVNVVDGQEVYVSGEIIGIYTECNGIFVIDTCAIESNTGELVNPVEKVLKTGDYILAVNGTDMTCKEDLVQAVADSNGSSMVLTINRADEIYDVSVTPVKAANGSYLLGAWVKDDLAGVGTLTYVSQTGEFGTLGHGMSNGETSDLLEVSGGDLYISKIIGIEKGQKGEPGEVKGVINYGSLNHLGEVEENQETGVYGYLDSENLDDYIEEGEAYKVAYKQEIEVGPAQIISEISGERKYYDIEITYVDYLAINSNKGLHIKVTDPELLELTGGIVQGMSGSPIIQNGKIVGAVTHVLINDPTSGYGIFIETMLENN